MSVEREEHSEAGCPPPAPSRHEIATLQAELNSLRGKNQRLAQALTQARQQLLDLRSDFEKISGPPSQIGIMAQTTRLRAEARVFLNQKEMVLKVHPRLSEQTLCAGSAVRISEELVVTEFLGFPELGPIATVSERLDETRALITNGVQEPRVVRLSDRIEQKLRVGDSVLLDPTGQIAVTRVERKAIEQLLTPETPQVSYEEIGGLKSQLEQIRDSVELPFLYPELYQTYGLKPPKGILLYGPPGCGKTLIAKAVATSLGQKRQTSAYFLSIKGPELLSKFVGETERQIRAIFTRARELASAESPVVIFFDEVEALFRTRGSGISSDVETMIVPQILAELDGVEALQNVIIIGASNREDMIDPALLRPGRLDVRIKVARPTLSEAAEIFKIHFGLEIPVQPIGNYSNLESREELCTRLQSLLAAETPQMALYEVTYEDGTQRIYYAKDLLSGAMIASIVERAKRAAIKATLRGTEATPGVTWAHLQAAAQEEIAQTAAIGAAENGREWGRILGEKQSQARIIQVRSLH